MERELTATEQFAIIWAQHQEDLKSGAFKKYKTCKPNQPAFKKPNGYQYK